MSPQFSSLGELILGAKRGVLLAVLLAFAFAMAVRAEKFSVASYPVQDSITGNEQAEYQLAITNNQAAEDTFRIRAPEVFWSIQSKPLYQYFSGVDIPPRSSESVVLLVNPIQDLPAGQYKVEIDIESLNTGEVQQAFLIVNVRGGSLPLREYLPSVARRVEMPGKIDPRQPVQVTIILENKNPRKIESLSISGVSAIFKAEAVTSLEPLAKKVVRLNVSLSPSTTPQKDTAVWSFQAGDYPLEPVKISYEIIAYSDVASAKKPAETSFLASVDETVYENRGNSVAYQTVKYPTNFLKRIFTSTEPPASYVSGPEGSFLVWEIALQPGEKATVRVVENYRILAVLMLLGAVMAALYYFFRSPVTIRKEAAIIGFEEGGISDIKVILHARNRTRRAFERLTLVDRVPAIATIAKEMEIGSLKPVKTVNSREGMLIRWELENLEKYEERVFSYTIKSKLSILGRFTLPRCTARFNEGTTERKTSSNTVTLSI